MRVLPWFDKATMELEVPENAYLAAKPSSRLLSLHNHVARTARVLAGRYKAIQASRAGGRAAREGLI